MEPAFAKATARQAARMEGYGEEDRSPAGDARHARPADAAAWPGARLHDCQDHRTAVRHVPAGRTGIAVPRAEPARGPRLGRFLLGDVREQPSRALLPPHAEGPAPAAGRNAAVGAARSRHWPGHAAAGATGPTGKRRGVTTCGGSFAAAVSIPSVPARCRRPSITTWTISLPPATRATARCGKRAGGSAIPPPFARRFTT